MQLFFALTMLVSATLLFLVQPMFAKMVLPSLGGTPAVWNTCMVFYQAVLLAGYLYAHLATRWLGPRRQATWHLLVLCLPWLALPIGVAYSGALPSEQSPIFWLLGCLTLSVGLPFFVVSTSAPMLQTWFAATRHPASRDPYFLYAASNLGSLAALLSYPLLVEPRLTLAEQAWLWTCGYGLLTLLTVGCAALLWHTAAGQAGSSAAAMATNECDADTARAGPTWGLRSWWLALSFAPSSLLLGVTTYLSTDIAAVPLLWVIPLALYLLTFVLVFARWPSLPHEWVQRWMAARRRDGAAGTLPPGNRLLTWLSPRLVVALDPYRVFLWLHPFLVVLLAVAFLCTSGSAVNWLVLVHLAAFFVTAMVCHGELVRSRPQAHYLTEFYICMSVGGVLGGLFNALVAPLTFTSIVEYPLVVALACCLRPPSPADRSPNRARVFDLLVPVLLLAALKGLAWVRPWQCFPAWTDPASRFPSPEIVVLGLAGLMAFGSNHRPVRFGLCVGSLLLASHLWYSSTQGAIFAGRSFFGVVRVQETIDQIAPQTTCVKHTLVHGSTVHGAQWFLRDTTGVLRDATGAEPAKPQERSLPLTYYSSSGPLGQVVRGLIDPAQHRELGVVGLGTGSIAAWGQPGQTVTYFEIDPLVVRVANDPRYFTFIAESQARIDMVLGDARLKLVEQPDSRFDLLVIDAFSSDAIPLHLLTREALALYLRKLHPEGILLFHISSRHLHLAPVLANLAADVRAACRRYSDTQVSDEQQRQGKLGSEWVVLVRDVRRLGILAQERSWETIAFEAGVGVWTDDFSNVLTVVKWFR